MYLHKELETLTRPEIEKLQLERLQKTVRHCMNSPFYKQRFAENHLSPEDIRSLDDLQKIPFTTKQDLRDTYPFGLASVPLEKTVRLHSSSGTTGNPTVSGPLSLYGRITSGRYFPELFRLWNVHRRAGLSIWC